MNTKNLATSDTLTTFLAAAPVGWVAATELHQAFVEFAKGTPWEMTRSTMFGLALNRLGVVSRRSRRGVDYHPGWNA